MGQYYSDFIQSSVYLGFAALCSSRGLSPEEAQRAWDQSQHVPLPFSVGEAMSSFTYIIDGIKSARTAL